MDEQVRDAPVPKTAAIRPGVDMSLRPRFGEPFQRMQRVRMTRGTCQWVVIVAQPSLTSDRKPPERRHDQAGPDRVLPDEDDVLGEEVDDGSEATGDERRDAPL